MQIIPYNEVLSHKEQIKFFIKSIMFEFNQPNLVRLDLDDLSIYCKGLNKLLVMLDAEQVIGTIGILKVKRRYYLKRFYIRREHRGKTYGRLLFNAIISYVKSNNIKKLYLNCDSKKMKVAYVFYQNTGFIVINEREDGYLTMLLDISKSI